MYNTLSMLGWFVVIKSYISLCNGCKESLQLHLSVVKFCSGPSGSITPIHLELRIEYRLRPSGIPIKPVLESVRDVAHYLSWTDSIKLSLQFSFFILFCLLLRDRLLPDFFIFITAVWKLEVSQAKNCLLLVSKIGFN